MYWRARGSEALSRVSERGFFVFAGAASSLPLIAGLDPAIQTNRNPVPSFLDARVEPGHEGGLRTAVLLLASGVRPEAWLRNSVHPTKKGGAGRRGRDGPRGLGASRYRGLPGRVVTRTPPVARRPTRGVCGLLRDNPGGLTEPRSARGPSSIDNASGPRPAFGVWRRLSTPPREAVTRGRRAGPLRLGPPGDALRKASTGHRSRSAPRFAGLRAPSLDRDAEEYIPDEEWG